MKTLLVFSTQKGSLLSWIIRKVLRSKCSHCCWLYHDWDLGLDMILEAGNDGFRLLPYHRFQQNNTVVRIINPKVSVDRALAFTTRWIGTPYDFKGLFGMAWVMLGRFLKRKWHNPFHSRSMVFCSESMARGLQHIEYPGFPKDNPETITPVQILEFFEAEPH